MKEFKKFRDKYIEDASELVAELEHDLLTLEHSPDDKSLNEKVFRTMHTLKGTSGMYGFEQIAEITHRLETIYDMVRSGDTKITNKTIDLTLSAVDYIKHLLQNPEDGETDISVFKNLMENIGEQVSEVEKDAPIQEVTGENFIDQNSTKTDDFVSYYIAFRPFENIYDRGVNPEMVLKELQNLGICKIVKYDEKKDLISDDTRKCFTSWDIFLSTKENINEVEDVFIFIPDEYRMIKIADENLFEYQDFLEKAEAFCRALPVSSNGISKDVIDEFLSTLKPKPVEEETGEKSETEEDNLISDEKQKLPDIKTATKEFVEQKTQSIRVASSKLDELINLVSELITKQAELQLLSEKRKDTHLTSISEDLGKMINNLKDNAFSVRLVPIESMIVGLRRLVRDLTADLNKEVQFVAQGMDTELDKNMIDTLSKPLMHILRNNIDHGIETPQERIKKGKPRKGRISMNAFRMQSHVYIQIEDDGAGIDLEKVRKKAIDKEFISESTDLSEKEIIALIFHPGFTTKEGVSEVSGRGVGMDVVRKSIEQIRGEIEIETKKDIGTVITIKLPLTLSIVDTLLVTIADNYYIIPLATIESCNRVTQAEIDKCRNNRIIIEGDMMPFVDLRQRFGITDKPLEKRRIIVVNHQDRLVGLIADKVVGQYQAVLKPVGEIFHAQDVISEVSILGDGNVALMIDLNKIFK